MLALVAAGSLREGLGPSCLSVGEPARSNGAFFYRSAKACGSTNFSWVTTTGQKCSSRALPDGTPSRPPLAGFDAGFIEDRG